MGSHWHNFGGRYGRGFHTNNWRNSRYFQFQQHSIAREDMPYPSYYQGTSHFQDRLVQMDRQMMDQQMDTQEEAHVDHADTWTTQSNAQEAVRFGGHGFVGERGSRDYAQSGIGNVSHRPTWKRRGLGPFRGGFRRGRGSPRNERGNERSFIRRQKDLQKKHEWTQLDHSLRGKGEDLKLDLSSDAAANLSLDEIISKATDNKGRCPVRNKGPSHPNLKIELDKDAAVNLSLGEIISKSHAISLN